MRATRQMVELRGDMRRDIVEMLDAVSLAQNRTRFALLTDILHSWCLDKYREATVVLRVLPDYPVSLEIDRNSDGNPPESDG